MDCLDGIGVATVGAGLTSSYAGLLVCRFMVGCFEAGLIPCERFFLEWREDTDSSQLICS